MLTLTPTAVEVVRTLTTATGVPEESGLRIAAADSGQELQISVTATPGEQDRVISDEGARVFLDQMAADYLDDKILDAQLDAGGQATFALGVQDGPAAEA